MKKLLLAAALLAIATSANAAPKIEMPAEFHGEWCGGDDRSCPNGVMQVSRGGYAEDNSDGKLRCAVTKAVFQKGTTNHSWSLTFKCPNSKPETEQWFINEDGALILFYPSPVLKDGIRFVTYERKESR